MRNWIKELWRPAVAALSAFVLFGMFCHGAEVVTPPAPTPVVFDWRELLITAVIGVAAFGGTIISWFFASLQSKVTKNDVQKEAWAHLEAGVTSAYHDLYDDLKAKRADGKLTDDDKAALRTHAIQTARDLATGPALEMLKVTALPILVDWVERIVLNRKAQAGTAAQAVPPATPA